jgi:SAM-dependent methyltransferase
VPDLQKIYAARFEQTGLERRRRVWEVLCQRFFNPLVGANKTVLDLACGYGEFINAVQGAKKLAVDLNPDAQKFLASDVTHNRTAATDLSAIASGSVDVVFTSNFLEHLRDKSECDKVFSEVKTVLRPGGRFIVMGPNIRYAFKEYWDYYDHYLPFSHLSLAEGLRQAGFVVTTNIPRFLPYTMNSSMPTAEFLVRVYLALPFAWRILGKQFLVVAEKPLGTQP